jgi:formylglycine-generating enzyme required for sulfatase activity
MVQIPFHLPPLSVDDVEGYIAELVPDGDALIDKRTRAVLARGLFPNPRQVKRILNIFRLLRGLVEQREQRPVEQGGLEPGKIAWPLLAKTILIQAQWPELYRDWRQYPTLIRSLEEAYARQPVSEERIVWGEMVDEIPERGAEDEDAQEGEEAETRQGGLLDPYRQDWRKYILLRRLLTYPELEEAGEGRVRARFTGMERDDLRAYVYLVSVATESGPERAEVDAVPVAEELLQQMLSGDQARIQDAVEQLQGADESQLDYSLPSWRNSLVKVLESPQAETRERVSAGDALAYLGDPRFDPDHWHLPDDNMLGFVHIPAGPFLMGSDPEKDPNALEEEQPQHEVHLPRYYIARYPVTVAQFRTFVDASGYDDFDKDALKDLPNHPIRYMTWDDARTYCLWLDERLRGAAGERIRAGGDQEAVRFWGAIANSDIGATLPSEAEWEKAARGGLPTPDVGGTPKIYPKQGVEFWNRIYPWGNEFDPDKANTKETGLKRTSAVGAFPGGSSFYEVQDLSGNVWEWTRSLWGKEVEKPEFEYPYDPSDGRENLDASRDVLRVLRGGAFLNNYRYVRCAYRFDRDPYLRLNDGGFRVCVSPFARSEAEGHP